LAGPVERRNRILSGLGTTFEELQRLAERNYLTGVELSAWTELQLIDEMLSGEDGQGMEQETSPTERELLIDRLAQTARDLGLPDVTPEEWTAAVQRSRGTPTVRVTTSVTIQQLMDLWEDEIGRFYQASVSRAGDSVTFTVCVDDEPNLDRATDAALHTVEFTTGVEPGDAVAERCGG